MHRGHDHNSEDGGGTAGVAPSHAPASIGHNGQRDALQWQTPHRPDDPPATVATDLDQIEAAFVEAFPNTGDSISFLKLAGILVSGRDPAGGELHLLRVEIEDLTDVGALSPLFGGGLRYAALSNRMISRRRRLQFIYFDGVQTRRLSLGEARALEPYS